MAEWLRGRPICEVKQRWAGLVLENISVSFAYFFVVGVFGPADDEYEVLFPLLVTDSARLKLRGI